jgi:TetR/AcrR family transcriptional regulator, regulator of biofilm formation and stress response
MARTPRQGTPARGEGRDAILDAVVRVVAQRGFDALTYRAVAAEAGVTHGLVSYHFGSREAMIHAALVRAAREAIHSSSIDAETEDVDAFAAGLAGLVAHDPDGQAFQQILKLEASRRPAVADEVKALRRTYLDSVGAALERLGLPEDESLARLVLAALDGLVLQQLLFRDPALTEGAVDRLHAVLRLVLEHGLPERAAVAEERAATG